MNAGCAAPGVRSRCAGFTLVELLVAMTLVTVVMALLYEGLRLGMRAWEMTDAHAGHSAQVRRIEGFLRQRLEQVHLRSGLDNGGRSQAEFNGTRQVLRFLAPMPRYTERGGLYEFVLRVAPGARGKQLELSYRMHGDTGHGERTDVPVALADGFERATFSYFGAQGSERLQWHHAWTAGDSLPLLIRVHIDPLPGAAAWPELLVRPRQGPYRIAVLER